MSKQALRDAFMAGRRSMGDYGNAGDHAFEQWMQRALDTADRSPTPASTPAVQEFILGVLCNRTNPPKPVAVDVMDQNSRFIASITLDEFKRCAADLERLERDRSPMIIGIDHAAPDSEITVTYIVDADGRVVG